MFEDGSKLAIAHSCVPSFKLIRSAGCLQSAVFSTLLLKMPFSHSTGIKMSFYKLRMQST